MMMAVFGMTAKKPVLHPNTHALGVAFIPDYVLSCSIAKYRLTNVCANYDPRNANIVLDLARMAAEEEERGYVRTCIAYFLFFFSMDVSFDTEFNPALVYRIEVRPNSKTLRLLLSDVQQPKAT